MVSQSEDAPPPAAGTAVVTSSRPGRLRRLGRWLTGTAGVERARSRLPTRSKAQGELLKRSRLAVELGRGIVEPANPSRHGRGWEPAVSLYQQAIYWALLAFSPGEDRPNATDLWNAEASRLATLGATPEELSEVEALFKDENVFITLAERPADGQARAAELMRAVAERLLDEHDGPGIELSRRRLSQAFRLGLLFATLLSLAGFGIALAIPERVDLAEGKPWRASSELYPCYPEKADCGGTRTRILFHTREEHAPWFEIDLGEPTRFSSMTIRNRTDFGPQRAVPLIVEVSDDGNKYRKVAERSNSFTTWKPEFSPEEARYVRLRANKFTFLHLEGVEIHP